jgi:hypothetical protein
MRLSDPKASRLHASLELTESGLLLTDLASTNGTFVGSLLIEQLYLQGGETVMIGNTKIEVVARMTAPVVLQQGEVNAITRHLALGDRNVQGPDEDDAAPSVDKAAGHPFVADPFDDVIAEGLPLIEARKRMIEAFERRYLTAALAATGGNVTHAARAAGIPRRYFQALRAKRFKPG